MVSFDKALELALTSSDTLLDSEEVSYENLLNRVASIDIYAVKNLPSYNNSAMDGYAFKHEDIKSKLTVVDTIYAGNVLEPKLKKEQCYKIMTGAKVPNDADTIAAKEVCEVIDDVIMVKKELKKHNALRFAGEEVTKGKLLIKKGELLNASKIALLASQGLTSCQVYKKLTIAIASTGDELKEPGDLATDNEVYNINAISLQMYLKEYGFESEYVGKIPDNFSDSLEFIKDLKKFNVVVTSGGASKGDKDYILKALDSEGFKEIFSGVNVKPGHPTTFSKLSGCYFIALPGNPLAAILNFRLLAIPVIYKMQGSNDFAFKKCKVKMGEELKLRDSRTNIVLGKLIDGHFIPYKNNKYGSGMITPLVESNAVAIFKEGTSCVNVNSSVEVVLI